MQVNKLRQLVPDYKRLGLSIEKRKFIQKQIGKSKASKLVKELDSFIKSDGCKSLVSPLSIEKYNDKLFLELYIILERTNSLFRIFSELETKNLQNTLIALKKIKNIRPNVIKNYLSEQKIKSDFKIEKISDYEFLLINNKWSEQSVTSRPEQTTNYYKITENNNPVALFSLYENKIEYEFGDFVVAPNKRKTKSLIDILKTMSQVVNTDKTICCAALESQPELVKMYEKCGFRLIGICSEFNSKVQEVVTAFTMINHK